MADSQLDGIDLEQRLLYIESYIYLIRDDAAEKRRIIDVIYKRPSRGFTLACQLKVLHVKLPENSYVRLHAYVFNVIIVVFGNDVVAHQKVAGLVYILEPDSLLHYNKDADIVLIFLYHLPDAYDNACKIAIVHLRSAYRRVSLR